MTDLLCSRRLRIGYRERGSAVASGCPESRCRKHKRLPGHWSFRCKREGEVSTSTDYGTTPVARLQRILPQRCFSVNDGGRRNLIFVFNSQTRPATFWRRFSRVLNCSFIHFAPRNPICAKECVRTSAAPWRKGRK